jgi:hypothetical protein
VRCFFLTNGCPVRALFRVGLTRSRRSLRGWAPQAHATAAPQNPRDKARFGARRATWSVRGRLRGGLSFEFPQDLVGRDSRDCRLRLGGLALEPAPGGRDELHVDARRNEARRSVGLGRATATSSRARLARTERHRARRHRSQRAARRRRGRASAAHANGLTARQHRPRHRTDKRAASCSVEPSSPRARKQRRACSAFEPAGDARAGFGDARRVFDQGEAEVAFAAGAEANARRGRDVRALDQVRNRGH